MRKAAGSTQEGQCVTELGYEGKEDQQQLSSSLQEKTEELMSLLSLVKTKQNKAVGKDS